MELASNVIGLLLTATLVGLWLCQASRTRPQSRVRSLAAAVAVASAASFIFPAVSCTDDLQAEQSSLVLKAPDSDVFGTKWKPTPPPFRKWDRPPMVAHSGFTLEPLRSHFQSLNIPDSPHRTYTPRGTIQDRSPPARATF
jgi:hypothetical protein